MTALNNPLGLLGFLVSIVGLVAAILLRDRDRRASLLLTVGFAVNLLDAVLGFVFGFVQAAIDASSDLGNTGDLNTVLTIADVVGLVTRLVLVAGLVLVFLGLLRLARQRTTGGPGVAR